MKKHCKYLLSSALCLPLFTRADDTWTGTVDGNWNTPGNWLDGSVPGNSQALGNMIFLTNPGAGNLTMNHNRTSGDSVYGITMNANATGPIVIGGNALGMGAGGIDMSTASFDLTFNNIVNVNAGGGVWTVPAGRVLTFNDVNNGNGVTTAGAGTIRLSGGAGTDNTAFAITVGGTTTLELDKTSAADRAIGNSLTVNNGATARLTGNSGNLIWQSADVTLNAGGVLDLNGRSEAFDGLAGAGTVQNNSATAVNLTVGDDNTSTTFTGFITQSSGVISVTKGEAGAGATGQGTLVLAPTAAGNLTYTGPTTINEGSIRVNANAHAAIVANSRYVFNGAHLENDATLSAMNLTLGTGTGNLSWGSANGGFAAQGGPLSVTFNGGAGLTWGQANFVQNNASIGLGGLTFGNGGFTATITNPINLGGTTGGANGTLRSIRGTGGGAAMEGAFTGVISGASALRKEDIASINLANAGNTHEGGTFVQSGGIGYASRGALNAVVTGGLEAYVAPMTLTTSTGNSQNPSVAYTGVGAATADFFAGIADHNFASTVTLAANSVAHDFSLAPAGLRNDLYLGVPAGNNLNPGTLTPANSTYRLGGGNGQLNLSTANTLTGANAVVVRDGGVASMTADQNFTGALTINGGAFQVRTTGTNLSGSSDITVNGLGAHGQLSTGNLINGYNGGSATIYSNLKGGALLIQDMNDPTGAWAASRGVVLNGGAISGHLTAANDIIQVPSATLQSGYSMIGAQPQTAGTGHVLLGSLTRANPGATVEFRSQFGTLGAAGDTGKIQITTLNGAAPANLNGIIGGWALASSGGTTTPRDFATWTGGASGVTILAIPGADQTSTTPLMSIASPATANVLVNNATVANNAVTSSITVNSLTVERDMPVTAGQTLTIGSGGILFRGTNGTTGPSGNVGSVTSGYNSGLPSAPNELFLHASGETGGSGQDARIRSIIADNGGTPVMVVKGGPGQVTIESNHSFTGGILVNEGTLLADMRAGGAGTLDAVNTVTVRSGGIFATGLQNAAPLSFSNTINLDGGTLRNTSTGGGTGATVTWTGTLNVTSLPNASAYIDTPNGRDMVLGPAATLTGSGHLSRINSAGTAAVLDIQTANTSGFTGNIVLTAGTTQVSGAGLLPNVDYFLTGGTLGVTTTSGSSIRSLAGVGGTISGNAGGTDRLTVNQTIDTAFHGVVSNTEIAKAGTGHLLLTGAADNGAASVSATGGILTLGKASNRDVHAAGLSANNAVVVSGGTVRLGGNYTATGTGGNAPPTYFNAAGTNVNPESDPTYVDQIFKNSGVTVNSGSFDLNGRSEAIQGLDGTGGQVTNNGSVDGTLMVGTNNGNGSYSGSINDGAAKVNLVKVGTGTQTLSGVNGHTGKTTVAGGTLAVTSGNEASLGANPSSPVSDQLTLSGGTLSITGASLTINDVNRGVAVSLSSGTFAVDTGLSLTLENTLSAAAAGSTLFKSGAGTFNLSANASINALDVVGGNFRQNTGTTQILTSTTGLKIRNGGTYVLAGGTLRADRIDVESGGSFEWGGGTIAHLTTNSSAGNTDYSSPTYHAVQAGANLEITGNLTSTSGSVLALHASPTLYLNAGVRFNTVSVDGNLNLVNPGDTLEFELNPYYLRPFSSAGISAIETGSLPFITWTGAWDGGFFDNVTGIPTTINFQEYTGGPVTDPNSLPIDTWQLEYDAAAKTIWFHYKVSGYVPEPGSFGLLAVGTLGLRLMRTLRTQRRRIDPAA